jgi:hypothetical protein
VIGSFAMTDDTTFCWPSFNKKVLTILILIPAWGGCSLLFSIFLQNAEHGRHDADKAIMSDTVCTIPCVGRPQVLKKRIEEFVSTVLGSLQKNSSLKIISLE